MRLATAALHAQLARSKADRRQRVLAQRAAAARAASDALHAIVARKFFCARRIQRWIRKKSAGTWLALLACSVCYCWVKEWHEARAWKFQHGNKRR